jgi:hypothetical protein
VLFGELERSLGTRLKHLGESDRAALTQMMESAVNKLLHAPTTRLKVSAADGAAADFVDALKHLFDLPEHASIAPPRPSGDAVAKAAPQDDGDDDDHVRH